MLSALAAGEDLDLKTGLWEVTISGMSSMGIMAPAEKAQMDKALAEMSPEQRAKTEEYMKSAMANLAKPTVSKSCMTKQDVSKMSTFAPEEPNSTCKQTGFKSTSTLREYREESSGEGGKTSGTVRIVAANPENVTFEWFSGAGWTGEAKFKASGKWLGSDCGNVKPH